MEKYVKLLLAGLLTFAIVMGCQGEEDLSRSFSPESAGERGTSCDSKNDCGSSLSCILGICQPADFSDLQATMKECYRLDCEATSDCCEGRVTEAPAKCRGRDVTCSSAIPGCETTGNTCFSNADCSGGALCAGNRTCNTTGISCNSDTDCDDVCEFPLGAGGAGATGLCSISGSVCTGDANCAWNGDTCGGGFCSCDNPNFDPFDPICDDEDCDDVCTLVCENRRCVDDNSCESNADCVAGNRNLCSDDLGECVECEANSDCDDPLDEEDDDDECNMETGTCYQPCRGDAECGMFQACNVDDGTCEFVGCRTNQECILLGLNAGVDDQRLLTCVQDDDGIGTCTISCEIDAHCPGTHVCEEGSCMYIGCQEDTDCFSLLGLNNWDRTTVTPWTPEAVCSEEPPAGIAVE